MQRMQFERDTASILMIYTSPIHVATDHDSVLSAYMIVRNLNETSNVSKKDSNFQHG